MARTITEKYQDGKLVERVIVEDEHTESITWPNGAVWPYAWQGIIPPPAWGEYHATISGSKTVG
jgi:hypothetical protein